ncbi:MAG: NUDIX domain-containing protein [Anaerolineae bacterium]|nr:NUDIX domain-containing protein [Anaerolineae bacterium]
MTEVVVAQAHSEIFTATIKSPPPLANPTRGVVAYSGFEDRPHRLPPGAGDYVNALVLNESGEVLILPVLNPHSERMEWQLVSGSVEMGEDPLTAVQRILHTHTGCQTSDWTYLSSYLSDLGCQVGVGHFFCAQKVKQSTPPAQTMAPKPHWIPLKELRYALLDGRVASISHAANISLALLTILK